MKTLKFTSLLAIVIISYSCEKTEELTINDHLVTEPSTVVNLEGKEQLPQVNGYFLEEGVLHFETNEAFESLLKQLNNHSENYLDLWEKEIGFYSLRRTNNETHENPEIDDYEFDLQRMPDIYFESILNNENKVVISGKAHFMEPQNNRRSSETTPFNTSAGNCRFYSWLTKEREVNGLKQMGRKWNNWGNFFSKTIGTETITYKRNQIGVWKRHKVGQINLLLDQWATLETCIIATGQAGYQNCLAFTNERSSNLNASRVSKVFRRLLFTNDLICAPTYGRIHHWAEGNLNTDCHTEAADW